MTAEVSWLKKSEKCVADAAMPYVVLGGIGNVHKGCGLCEARDTFTDAGEAVS